MKKSLVGLICLAMMSVASATVIQGEVTPGVYPNVLVDATGKLLVTATSSAATGSVTNRSGTITSGGSAQTIMAANTSRKYLLIQNTSDTTMWCNFTTTAVATQPSFQLVPGSSFVMEGNYVSTELISCIGATTGKIFTAKEG